MVRKPERERAAAFPGHRLAEEEPSSRDSRSCQGLQVRRYRRPPRVNEVARSAVLPSDLVLIPVQPSPYDVWAAKEIVDLLSEVTTFNEKVKSAFVINRKIVNTAIGRDVSDALSGYPIAVLKAQICQRVPFAETAGSGQTVLEVDPEPDRILSRRSQRGRSLQTDSGGW